MGVNLTLRANIRFPYGSNQINRRGAENAEDKRKSMDLAIHNDISIYLTLRPLISLAVQTLIPQSCREHAEHSCLILDSLMRASRRPLRLCGENFLSYPHQFSKVAKWTPMRVSRLRAFASEKDSR